MGGSKELLTDGDFFSSQTLTLSGKPIAFSHIVSKTKDISLQSGIVEVCDCSVDKAVTGMGGVKDLEGVVSKEPRFGEIRGCTRVGVDVAGVNFCRRSLTTFNLWVG
jgi:hypothetical protein